MGKFVYFWGYYGLGFYISIDIELIITENYMQFRLTFYIKLVSFKNIDILPIDGLKSTKFRAYGHMVFGS